MPSITLDQVKSLSKELYDDETRPGLIAKGLVTIGAEKVLPPSIVDYVASLTTYSGLKEKSSEAYEVALPYIKKAKHGDGRAELVEEAKELVTKTVIEPATPYVMQKKFEIDMKVVLPAKAAAAPYIAKVSSTKEAIMSDRRVEKALAGIAHVREHPQEVVADLKAKAVDLIKYDDLASYREYVQSPEFAEDTRRLIQVELPAIAKEAAAKGKEKLALTATALQQEIEVKGSAMVTLAKRGYEWGRTAEFEEVQASAMAFVVELKAQIAVGFEKVKSGELSLSEIISRVTKAYIEFGATPAPATITDEAADETTEVAVTASDSSASVAAVASPPAKDHLEEEE
jgi:hypothetical protein